AVAGGEGGGGGRALGRSGAAQSRRGPVPATSGVPHRSGESQPDDGSGRTGLSLACRGRPASRHRRRRRLPAQPVRRAGGRRGDRDPTAADLAATGSGRSRRRGAGRGRRDSVRYGSLSRGGPPTARGRMKTPSSVVLVCCLVTASGIAQTPSQPNLVLTI